MSEKVYLVKLSDHDNDIMVKVVDQETWDWKKESLSLYYQDGEKYGVRILHNIFDKNKNRFGELKKNPYL